MGLSTYLLGNINISILGPFYVLQTTTICIRPIIQTTKILNEANFGFYNVFNFNFTDCCHKF